MKKIFNLIFSWFDFGQHQISAEFYRTAVLILFTALVAFLVAFIILQFTKTKQHEIGFSNWFKVCFMWGCVAAILALGIVVILTIRFNGLYYFRLEAFGLSWYCGYLLMLPEIAIASGWVSAYCSLNKSILKSIK